MSDYTIVNIRESEDFAPKFGMPSECKAHFPKKELDCKIGAVGLERLAPGFRTPFGHRHKRAGGAVRDRRRRRPREARRRDRRRPTVGRDPRRAADDANFEAGPEGLEVLAFGAPIDDENDGEIEMGW